MNANPKFTRGILQIIVAGYVIYLAYGLKDGILESTGGKQLFFILAAVFMTLAAIVVIIHAIKMILKKEEDTDIDTDTDTEELTETEDNDK